MKQAMVQFITFRQNLDMQYTKSTHPKTQYTAMDILSIIPCQLHNTFKNWKDMMSVN